MSTHARVVSGWLPGHDQAVLTSAGEGMVNGRPATDYELEVQARARAAALAAETSALFTGIRHNRS